MDMIPELDFMKKSQKIAAKVEKQSYAKLTFLIFGFAILFFSAYTISNVVIDKAKQNSMSQQKQEKLLVQQIKQMDEKEFVNMLNYISKNVSMYDAKVTFVQHIIVRAAVEHGAFTVDTDNARLLGDSLTRYKNQAKENVATLTKVRLSVTNDVDVDKKDIEIFLNYLSAYKSQLIFNDSEIDNKIHSLIYDARSGNDSYNEKNNVYERIKEFDNEVKNFFVVTQPKAKD